MFIPVFRQIKASLGRIAGNSVVEVQDGYRNIGIKW
jgi:hypothetical protein